MIPSWPDKYRDELLLLYRSGKSTSEIAKRLNAKFPLAHKDNVVFTKTSVQRKIEKMKLRWAKPAALRQFPSESQN